MKILINNKSFLRVGNEPTTVLQSPFHLILLMKFRWRAFTCIIAPYLGLREVSSVAEVGGAGGRVGAARVHRTASPASTACTAATVRIYKLLDTFHNRLSFTRLSLI